MTHKINKSLKKRTLRRMRVKIAQEKELMEKLSYLKTEPEARFK